MEAAPPTPGPEEWEEEEEEELLRRDEPQDNLGEQLVGASLAWSVGEEPMQLGEAVAMRVVRPEFLGMSRADWNGVFWASVLLLVTVICLYAAVRKENKEEYFCCD